MRATGDEGSLLGSVLPGGGYSKVDDVLEETASEVGEFTSRHILSADEALEAGERWVGSNYEGIGEGVFRGENYRQFRIDKNSLLGNHRPHAPHVQFEAYHPGANKPYVINHVKFYD